MNLDDYMKNLLAEMGVALEKIPRYSVANAIWHCGRLAYLAYALSLYISYDNDIDRHDETLCPRDIPEE